MRTRELLERIPALYASLEDALTGTRTGTSGDRVTGGGGLERPLPLTAEVAEHRHLLVKGLRYWVNVAHQRTAWTGRTPATIAQACAFLHSHLDHLTEYQETELRRNLLDWVHGAHRVTDLPQLRATIPLPDGTCPNRTQVMSDLPAGEAIVAELGDSEPLWACGGQLRVMLPADRGVQSWLQCKDCRARYSVTELPEAANVRLPLSMLAELTGTPVRTLQHRVQRGHLEATTAGARLGDVLRSDRALCP